MGTEGIDAALREASQQARAIHAGLDSSAHVVTSFLRRPSSPSVGGSSDGAEDEAAQGLQEELSALHRDGYVILPRVLQGEVLESVQRASREVLERQGEEVTGRNGFEGHRTRRVYGLLGKSRGFDALVAHPRVTRLLDRVLEPNYLLTALQVIDILPGERAQPLHYDDQFVPFPPRPRPPLSVGTVWAIGEDFTAKNGSTVVIPRSHTWAEGRVPADTEGSPPPIPVVMPVGSVVVFLSTLWHGGGPNRSDKDRLAVSAQYCQPWIRPQENQFLVVPLRVVTGLSPKLQTLLGYSIHPPFIGHVDGKHPLRRLAAEETKQRGGDEKTCGDTCLAGGACKL